MIVARIVYATETRVVRVLLNEQFLLRDAYNAYMSWKDVCLSVCLLHAGIVPKRLHISSKLFHRRVAPPF